MKDLAPDIVRQRLLIEGLYSADVDQRRRRDAISSTSPRIWACAPTASPIVHAPGGAGKAENQGFDAFIPLIDSGISLYVWSQKRFFAAVLFTCKRFDVNAALRFHARLLRADRPRAPAVLRPAGPAPFARKWGVSPFPLSSRLMNDSPESPPESPSLTRRRRTFLAPLWLLAMAGVFVLAMAVAYWNSATTTTIVLVRHAEKQLGAISDAPLSPQGEMRATPAGADVRRQRDVRPRAARSTSPTRAARSRPRRRSRSGSDLNPAKSWTPRPIRRNWRAGCCARIAAAVALVVGHSNTVPEIVAALAHAEKCRPSAKRNSTRCMSSPCPTIGKASVLRLKY